MVLAAFHDLTGRVLEVWMDDVATACDEFEVGLENLRLIFAKCRAHGLSLSPTKTVLFMSEARFAGARCSSKGVRPDLSKVRAILKWPELKTALKVLSFLGDTVTHAPIYDGQPFVVTTDGSKYRFGAVLSQAFDVTDSSRVTRQVMYPIAFASKQTSRTEEKYIPFLLEFAALKFGLDEFNHIIFGQSIELETDCKALADLLGNDKLNSTHERWRESIIARHIVVVCHRPGNENWVCDALYRMYESRPDDNTGPGADDTVDPGWESAKGLINNVCHLLHDSESAHLLKRFESDLFFTDILLHLIFDAEDGSKIDSAHEARAKKRRAHRAEDYLVEDGKLWLTRGKGARMGNKVECIPSSKTKELALAVHSAGGHFGRDMTILALQRRYFWPEMRRDVIEAVTSCPCCKNFGPCLLSAQMQPITRACLFDLLVGDYVSLPTGHGGFKTVLVLVDVYSCFMFTFPLRGPGTGKSTVDTLSKIADVLLAHQEKSGYL
ncbi:Retrovirus-related Pol polyprotein from transposon opus [Ceratobasidium sp. AG-Ba]|nr:Retrovirus-related Pol polyprotein from transposon opus [Ceratobasidium sp. AG-Ba]